MCKTYVDTTVLSTVDKVKEAYSLLGWNGEKTEQHRKALSDIKDIGTTNLDHPFTYIKSEVEKFRSNENTSELLFVHSREPDEIKRFVENFDCVTLLMKNDNAEDIQSNHADAEVANYKYDYEVDNDGTISDLKNKAWNFIVWLQARRYYKDTDKLKENSRR